MAPCEYEAWVGIVTGAVMATILILVFQWRWRARGS